MKTFADRLNEVIGESASPHGWAVAHGLRPQKVWEWLKKGRQPQRAQLDDLASRTGIPVEWWESGDTPPPVVAAPPHNDLMDAGAFGKATVTRLTTGDEAEVAPFRASAPRAQDAPSRPSDPDAEERRQMLLTMLRTMEHRLLEPLSMDTAAAMLQAVDAWQGFARSDPDLQRRLAAVRSAARLYACVQLPPK